MFPAIQPTIATVPPGEKVLHTARINPFKYEARGGMILKITMYHPEGTEHRIHLTDGHILLEPAAPSSGSYLISSVLVTALGYALGGASEAVGAVGKVLEMRDAQNAYTGQWIALPHEQILKTDSFRQWLTRLARIYVTGGHEKGFAFSAHPPDSGQFSMEQSDAWAALMRDVIGR